MRTGGYALSTRLALIQVNAQSATEKVPVLKEIVAKPDLCAEPHFLVHVAKYAPDDSPFHSILDSREHGFDNTEA